MDFDVGGTNDENGSNACEKIGLLSSLALSGSLSFQNFGMPGIIAWATFRRSQHTR
jgi:hypothetical protein